MLEVLVKTPDRLSAEFVASYAEKTPPWGPIGYIIYKRTYARTLEHLGRTEEFHETLERCVNALIGFGKGALTIADAETLYDYLFNLNGALSGRAMWQLGTHTVDRIGGASLCNCWLTAVDSPEAFLFTFDLLMLGGGVGFNIQREHVYQLPKVAHNVKVVRNDTKDADFIVPDSREGWVELLRRTLDSFFTTGNSFTYSTICIRGKGTPISGFGGVASGPEDLCVGIEQIATILSNRLGKRLRPIDCLDILNIIGAIVVAGNVRRSAEIGAGDPDDFNFLRAKRWEKGTIPNWRSMSNNTLVVNDFEHIPNEFWLGYQGKGEPYGLFNRDLARAKGRLADSHRKDPLIEGVNPCAEICLEDKEPCNLSEIFLPNIANVAEYKAVAVLLQKVNKIITTLPYHWAASQEVVSRNRRIGESLTGIWQAPALVTAKTLTEAYRTLEEHDTYFSKVLGDAHGIKIPESIKLTTIKPSGTLSLLAGVSPGIHPEFAHHYVRRVRMSANDPLVATCTESGYKTEPVRRFDGSLDHGTTIVEFPVKARPNSVVADELTAIRMLEKVKFMQTYWADNSVSCTVYYTLEELDDVKEWLKENYNDSLKTVSFLLKKDHGFDQAPIEEISENDYGKRASHTKPLGRIVDEGGVLEDSFECEGGACPIK